MKIFKEMRLFYWRDLLAVMRNPVFIFFGLSIPILYLFLFAPLLKNLAGTQGFPSDNVLDIFVPGMLVMIAFSGGLFSGFGIIDEVRFGVIERFRVTPSSRFAILAGPVLRDVTATLVQCTIFILIALAFGFHANFWGLICLKFFVIMVVGATSAFSNAMGLITKDEEKFAPIVHGINLPLLLLSGVLLPMAYAPTWLLVIAHFNPLYYVVDAARYLAAGQIFTAPVGYAFLVMIPVMLLVMGWATKVFRKAVC